MSLSMRGCFTYASHVLSYSVRFSDRRTLSISVQPDCSIEAIAPLGTPDAEIQSRLKKRGAWVLRQQRYFEQFRPRTPERRYVGGETHLYLGRQYRLERIYARSEGVKVRGGHLCVSVIRGTKSERVRTLVLDWYRKRAKLKLKERFEAVRSKFATRISHTPELLLRPLKQRWGSHTPAGRIILNYDLIRAPTSCIDYVIAHELAHVVHRNHDAAFYGLLDQVMHDWQKREEILERLLS
jgi:predicted metal-dependent hydrolase